MTIFKASSDNGRCKAFVSSHGAVELGVRRLSSLRFVVRKRTIVAAEFLGPRDQRR
jgi:hypothetical protein